MVPHIIVDTYCKKLNQYLFVCAVYSTTKSELLDNFNGQGFLFLSNDIYKSEYTIPQFCIKMIIYLIRGTCLHNEFDQLNCHNQLQLMQINVTTISFSFSCPVMSCLRNALQVTYNVY